MTRAVKVTCDRCDGRGFYRAPVRYDAPVNNLACFCERCDGRGTLTMKERPS